MKLNKIIRKSPKGVTLIELSVVIAVILVLISVLFIGASYYRDAANEAACNINQSSIKKGADSYLNIENLTTATDAQLVAGPFPAGLPACPTAGAGAYTTTYANGEVAAATCSDHGDLL